MHLSLRQALALRAPHAASVRSVPERALAPGEHLLWVGSPRRGLELGRGDWYAIPCSIVFLELAAAWAVLGSPQGSWLVRLVCALPALFAVYLAIGRFFVDARTRARTTYVITNRRVLLAVGARSSTLTTIDLATTSTLSLDENEDGTGNVWLCPRTLHVHRQLIGWPGFQDGLPPVLRGVPRAREVLQILHEARHALRPTASSPR